jgi:branched-chain amino acid transport system ATP-binding protein
VLEVRSLEVAYGGIAALKGVDLALGEGEMVCVIGANGAGKTTLLRALSGLVPSRAGEILYRGQRIAGLPPHEIARRGVVHVPEGRGLFSRLTVHENLQMGAYARHDRRIGRDLAALYERLPRLAERRGQLAGTLSGGEQQMVALGRAVMARPQLLLLDEPSMGLAPMMVGMVFDLVRSIASTGVTILLVEQNARLALKICARAYVLEGGRVVLSGASGDLAGDPRIQEAYLGIEHPAAGAQAAPG